MTILEFLTLVPEEVANTEIIGGKRAQITQELKESIPLVISTLSSFLISITENSGESTLHQKALGCLQSWIQYGVDFQEVYPLVRQSMMLLGNDDLFQSATDVLLEAMQQPSYTRYNTLRNDLLDCFSSDGMKLKLTDCISEEDDETAISLAKLLTGFGETFTDFIASQFASPKISVLLEMIMQLTDFPGHFPADQEVSEVPLNFWYMLQETLFDDGIIPIRQQQAIWNRQCGEEAMIVYRELVSVIKRKAAFPEDSVWRSWPKGKDLEATMFCLKSICEEVPADEDTYIRQFFGPKVLERLPTSEDFRLQNTVLLLTGALAEWLKIHPEFLPPVMNYIVPCLSVQRLSMSAATAFSDICDTCRESLTDALDSLMHANIMQKVVESVADVIQVLPPDRAIAPLMALAGDILQGVGKALTVAKEAPAEAREVILAQLQYLSACCRGIQSPNDDYQSLSARNSNYDNFANGQLAAMYAKVDGFHQFTSAIYDSVQHIAATWRDDEEIMKTLSHYIEAGIRSISPLLTLAFDDLAVLTVTNYQSTGFACWLHTATLIMTVYGGHETNYPRLRDLLGSLTEKTLGFIGTVEGKANCQKALPLIINQTVINRPCLHMKAMEQYPDVIDNYFELLSRVSN
ncbi:armadillo-type protein [Zychaea mexicana]|uniref:armadillo-type protein n=1 Tax=Zychaea mexicana TaxID=64656 RepID=UPI0022FE24C8|nr:armadillo-type protein [Zychaea mexicana]KAI9488680.1 armadillo-type protein [Zychaea mexicana]